MEWKVNEAFGRQLHEGSKIVNIYAFFCSGEFYLETLDTNLPISYVQQRFIRELVNKDLLSFPKDQRGNPVVVKEFSDRYSVSVALHVVLDRSRNRIILTEENTNPKVGNRGTEEYKQSVILLRSLAQWIVDNPQVVGEVEADRLSLSTGNVFWSHKNYSVMKVSDFPALEVALKDYDIESIKDMNILSLDFEDQKVVEHVEKQVGRGFVERSPYLVNLELSIDGRRIDPPTVIVNSHGKNEQTLLKVLYSFFIEHFKASYMDRMRSSLKHQYDSGYDIQDMYYLNFQREDELDSAGQVFDRDAGTDMKSKVQKLVEKWKIDPKDVATMNFIKMFMIYRSSFPLDDAGPQYKVFYNIISVPKVSDTPAPSPATRNVELFDSIFTVRGADQSQSRVYYLLSSRFCFPTNVFELVVEAPTVEQKNVSLHETVEFNTRNGLLSKYAFVNNAPKSGPEATAYSLKVMPSFSKTIVDGLGNYIKDNRINERVNVKLLSEFPYAYRNVLAAFERAGVEYRDIQVILIYAPGPRDIHNLGGYLSKTKINDEAVKLAEDHPGFNPPFIFFNVANPRMQLRENASNALIHEGRHFLDDILVSEGKIDPGTMGGKNPPPPKSQEEQNRNMLLYLANPTEINAHAEQAMTLLKHYSPDYLKTHWHAIKSKIIQEEFLHGEPGANEYPIVEGYGRILDRALELYLQDTQRSKAGAAGA